MAILNRLTLKNFFKKGSKPSEMNFSDLIDSTVNKLDDGYAKDAEAGLQLSPVGSSKNLIGFYKNIIDREPNWSVTLDSDDRNKGLGIFSKGKDNPIFFLSNNFCVGLGTNTPQHMLDVDGTVSMSGRVGNYIQGETLADGNWHPVITGLKGCVGFEIMARVGASSGRGKYAIAHILALRAFGGSNGKITINQSYYGLFLNKIKARWVGDVNDFSLELKTMTHYGLNEDKLPFNIHFQVTKLWDDSQLDNR